MSKEKTEVAIYVLVIVIAIIAGVYLDHAASNYELSYTQINVPVAENKTELKTIVTIPGNVELLRLSANFMYALALTLLCQYSLRRELKRRKRKRMNQLWKN